MFCVKKVNQYDKFYILEIMITSVLQAISTFLYPYILKVTISGIELKKPLNEILYEVLIVVGICMVITIVSTFLNKDLYIFRKNKINNLLLKEFHSASLNIDYEKFENSDVQDDYEKASKAVNGYNGIVDLIENTFNFISKFLVFVIALTVILTVSVWLVVGIISLSFINLLLEKYNRKKQKLDFDNKIPNIWRNINYADNSMRNLSIGKDLRIYKMNNFIENERGKCINKYLKYKKSNSKRNVFIQIVVSLIKAVDELLLYGFTIYDVIYNQMLISTFSFVIASVNKLIYSINSMILFGGYIVNICYIVNDYLDFKGLDLNKDNDTGDKLDDFTIEFDHVYYSYLGQKGYALEDVSFKINAKEKIALLGYNGAGKTTLIKLICGFYHPTKGKILINNIDINEYNVSSLQQNIAVVFQDINNHAFKIIENVSMKSITETNYELAMKALEITGLNKKINELPEKENTMLGRDIDEKGIELSGGETQKVSISRSIYKEAPLMILDEPTSSLDAIAELELYNNIGKVFKKSTLIFISHRLNSTKFCDRILFLEKGKLSLIGNHLELMEKHSKYFELYNMQAKYYQDGEEHE